MRGIGGLYSVDLHAFYSRWHHICWIEHLLMRGIVTGRAFYESEVMIPIRKNIKRATYPHRRWGPYCWFLRDEALRADIEGFRFVFWCHEQFRQLRVFQLMGMATELISNQFRGSLGYFTSIFDATHPKVRCEFMSNIELSSICWCEVLVVCIQLIYMLFIVDDITSVGSSICWCEV